MDKKVNWTKLSNPGETIMIFQPTPQKMQILIDRLLHEYLYIPDELRDSQKVTQLLQLYLAGANNLFYEFKNFGGILGFLNIIPEYKCEVIYKLWDMKLWGPTFLRDLKNSIALVIDEFQLIRMYSNTPDKKMERLAHMCGFKTECAQKHGFRWGGKLFPLKLLARTLDRKRAKPCLPCQQHGLDI